MINGLPPALKRQIRLMGCSAIARWRQYPLDLSSRYLTGALASAFQAKASCWQTISTPIPTRGDEITCTNRLHNLHLAIKAINNRFLKSGEAFSLSQHLGEPSEANGYRSGPVFKQGQVLSDAGGGLCLIATNLYQLFLHSGCTILERHNHSIDAYGEERFYALGEDAAIAYTTKDLVIRNPFAQPLLLKLTLRNHSIHSELIGVGSKPIQTIVQSVVLERQPSSGSQKHPGWSVSTSRLTKKQTDRNWRQDYLSFSDYNPC
ncbi:VanW family protein [Synechococcus sp. AH-551-B05]|nr:VanW family protein [Synechococcus sp. AH-551-B05]MDB4677326.1 VanW family protein [Synechococcus sp. AH-551-B05]